MKKIISVIAGAAMTLGLAGVSLMAQTPAPAAKPAAHTAKSKTTSKTHHARPKMAKKTAASAPAK